jgi:hypothetical protein
MFDLILVLFAVLVRLFHARSNLLLENLALRQQLAVLKRRHPRARLSLIDRVFWIAARRFWSGWKQRLIIVTPETVTRWHRAGFQMYWRWISRVRKRVGRKRIPQELRNLICRMVAENPTWGAPRIHGELLMLGFDVSESDGCAERPGIRKKASDVSLSCAITGKRLRPWISLPCLRSPSISSTVFSSPVTIADAFYIST